MSGAFAFTGAKSADAQQLSILRKPVSSSSPEPGRGVIELDSSHTPRGFNDMMGRGEGGGGGLDRNLTLRTSNRTLASVICTLYPQPCTLLL